MMALTFPLALLACLAVLCTTAAVGTGDDGRYVNITILHSATTKGAVCLNGSPPAYHLDMGHEFYNWNRARVKYCDGSSFTGDVEKVDPDNKLFFRGARIFNAIMEDLGSKGMQYDENAILSGVSAGGLATILNCDKFKSLLPNDARVKCVADAGFFTNGKTISGTSDIQEIYRRVITLHGSAKNLPPSCTSAMEPTLCFFPQNVVPFWSGVPEGIRETKPFFYEGLFHHVLPFSWCNSVDELLVYSYLSKITA